MLSIITRCQGEMGMRIIICEDNQEHMEILKIYIRNYFRNLSDYAEIQWFVTAEKFLSSGSCCDILFMDIFLSGMNGIDAVRAMEQAQARAVVFVTESSTYAVQAFALAAVHYLLKPLKESDVFEALDRCVKNNTVTTQKFLEVRSTVTGKLRIPVHRIVYIEVFNKISVIYMQKREIRIYKSLDALYALLDNTQFMRVQRSFIVNMEYIEKVSGGIVFLKNGKKINMSRAKRNKLMEQYQMYLLCHASAGGE